jgi:hypothetical protein
VPRLASEIKKSVYGYQRTYSHAADRVERRGRRRVGPVTRPVDSRDGADWAADDGEQPQSFRRPRTSPPIWSATWSLKWPPGVVPNRAICMPLRAWHGPAVGRRRDLPMTGAARHLSLRGWDDLAHDAVVLALGARGLRRCGSTVLTSALIWSRPMEANAGGVVLMSWRAIRRGPAVPGAPKALGSCGSGDRQQVPGHHRCSVEMWSATAFCRSWTSVSIQDW